MKEITKRKIKVVHESTAAKFEREYNKAMDALARFNPSVEFNNNQGFCAYFVYVEYEEIPENLVDRCTLAGYEYCCGECPFLDQSEQVNSHQKLFPCQYAKYGKTRVDSQACEMLYKYLIEENEIPASLRDAPDRTGSK